MDSEIDRCIELANVLEFILRRTTTITVCLSGALGDFVAANVGENGTFANVGEYVRDLIRRDKERAERETFDRLKAELKLAFAAPEDSFHPLFAAEVIKTSGHEPTSHPPSPGPPQSP